MVHRRQFLQWSTLAATACMASRSFAWLPEDHRYRKQLGLQLYTLRNQLAEDRAGTIAKVAAAGYYQVELMDAYQGQEIASLAKEHGLAVTSAFLDWRVVVTPDADTVPAIDEVIEDAKEIGLKYLVFGYVGKGHRETMEHFQKIAEQANAVGEKITAAGMKLCYHNHSFEFNPLTADTNGYEVLQERFDPKLVSFELDVFWAAVGGWSPIETLRRLGNRVTQLHLKDVKPGTGTIFDEGMVPANAFQEVGDGSIDFKELLKLADELGVDQCHVEQDQSPAPLDSIVQSHQYLSDLEL